MKSGIYCIENLINGKKYIGKGAHIKERFNDHKWKLKNKIHHNRHLQSAWNKYGEENFSFYVLEYCKKESLSEKESEYIAFFDSLENGYNMTLGGDGAFGYTHSEETKRKIGESNSGKIVSEEQIQKRKDTIDGWSEERRLEFHIKSSNSHKNFIVSEETKLKLSKYFKENPSRKCGDYNHSEETKRKISESLMGREISKESIEKRKKTIGEKTPEERAKTSKKMSESAKKRGISPETREKMIKARWGKE